MFGGLGSRRRLTSPWLRAWGALALCSALVAGACLAPRQAHADAPAEPAALDVTLHEAAVFRLQRGDGARSLAQRAQRASRALAEAVESTTPDQVTSKLSSDRATIFAGSTPIVELTAEDAALAGDSSLAAHAESVVSRVRAAMLREQERSRIANTVFSASLVVFFGLITVYLMRKLHDWAGGARRFLVIETHRVPALRLQRLEVLGPAAVRSVLLLVVSLGHGLGFFGLAYAWLVLSLSLFGGTRPYVERLTGLVLTPLSGLVARVATELPLFVVLVIAGGLVAVIVRIVELFFASVARGETKLSWLEPEIAMATSTLVRVGLVIFALVFAGPVITGQPDGALSRTGVIILFALALASTPLLASIVAGVALAFARALRAGDRVEYGGRVGIVQDIGLVVLTMADDEGGSIRVPHALSLFHPTRILKRARA
ncbi:MAG: uncharacterized protein JWN48_266 [Myxococcaceae bacterium]|nr:uncharacterized protein [Myxococcaceae bacterium]